jgi:hypothetical protein
MEQDMQSGPAHTRTLVVHLEQAAPSCWRAQGVILDLRKRGLVPMAGDLQTAGVIHHMRVDAEIDVERRWLTSMRADQPSVAFEAAPGTGGECCRDPVSRIEALSGSALDADFAKRLGTRIGGPLGCSHVQTLALCVGSTAELALAADRARHGLPARRAGERVFHRSLSIDGLAATDGSLVLALQLADVHCAPAPADALPFERLARHYELRVNAHVDLDTLTFRKVEAAERSAESGSGPSAWQSRDADVGWLAGQAAMGGVARAVLTRLVEPADAPLRDALLNLSPTVIQCVPAISERWRTRGGVTAGGSSPGMFASGGMVDSCYMWRRGGFLAQRVEAELRAYHAATKRS